MQAGILSIRKTSGNGTTLYGVVVMLFVVLFVLRPSGFVAAQSDGGAALFTGSSPAALQYGSLGYGSIGSGANVSGLSQNSLILDFQGTSGSNSGTSLSGGLSTGTPLLAQATPTPVTPVVSSPLAGTPVSTTTPILSGTSPVLMQPIDPYATPTQSSLFPSGSGSLLGSSGSSGYNSSPNGVYSGNFDRFVPETYEAMRRFREATSFQFTYLPRSKKSSNSDSFGMNEIDLRMQLAFPCRFIPNSGTNRSGPGYFYVAPGGSVVWWDGPVGKPDMPPNGFSAFLDFGVQPQFNDVFALDAWFRIGVFSDFKKVKSDSIRYQGRAVGLFTVSPQIKIAAGVIYMDRERIKIMPTGGIVWSPRDDWMLRLTFPNPKVSKRLWNSGCAEWWGYVNADYGGDSWYIEHLGKTDYNDIRVGIGLEFETYTRVNGYFELGGSFSRELYSGNQRWCKPPDVIYLKTGFIF